MITKADVIAKAMEQGFDDVGFTSAEPFDAHRTFLEQHQKEYGWVETSGLGLLQGTDPKSTLPGAETIIVLMEAYYKMANPTFLEAHFGRCYLDDDRVTKDGLALRI
jgi:epoxyqueuosine reductase